MLKQVLVLYAVLTMSTSAVMGQDPAFMKKREELKTAIIQQITAYMTQFDDQCFGKAVSLGNPDRFRRAIDQNINQIKVGQLGKESLAELSKTAMSMHHSYRAIGVNADLLFAFHPAYLPPGDSGYKDRQRLMHEMTHHIEFLKNEKYSSKTITGADNPIAERNTNYQDFIVDQLKILKKINELPPSKLGQRIVLWQKVEREIPQLEKGSAAGMNPHDPHLAEMTGFSVDFAAIKNLYLSGKCGVPLRDMALVSNFVKGLSATLEAANKGEKFSAKLVDGDGNTLAVPPELNPRVVWTLSDKTQLTGEQVSIPPQKPGNADVTVSMMIKLSNTDYELADAIITVKTAVKPASGYEGSYAARFAGDLNSTFTFTITKTGPGSYSVLGKVTLPSGKEYELYGEQQSLLGGVFYASFYDTSAGSNYRSLGMGSFSAMSRGSTFHGDYTIATFEKTFRGTWTAQR